MPNSSTCASRRALVEQPAAVKYTYSQAAESSLRTGIYLALDAASTSTDVCMHIHTYIHTQYINRCRVHFREPALPCHDTWLLDTLDLLPSPRPYFYR